MPSRKDRAEALAARSRFRLGELQVQPDRCTLVREGQDIKLEMRLMEVLVMLAEHAGETMSTERLLIEVWKGTFYGDNPVSKTISILRSCLGDDVHEPRYIVTVPKVGYRLIAPVSLPEDYRRVPGESDRWMEGSPYVGLSAFDAPHASVFCGRGRMLAELLAAMRSQIENQRRFVLILGPSGCGKTSLLRAGAIPLLTQSDGFEGLQSLSIAPCDLATAHDGDILKPLAEAIASWRLDDRPVLPPQTTDQLKAVLAEAPESIAAHIEEAFRLLPDHPFDGKPYAHLLLTIDHAEALVAANDINSDVRAPFMQALRALCMCPRVLTTMAARIDFYPMLMEALPMIAECKAGDGHFEVFAPREGEIAEIIRTPAWKANLSFEKNPETSIRLDDALRDAARSQPDVLPLLQHTLQMLYELRRDRDILTFAAYEAIGGLEGAIAHRAEEVFSSLPQHAQKSLDTVLERTIVVQPDSDAVSARRVDIDIFDADSRALIERFIDARLFVGGLRGGIPTVGVAHEALLRRWPRAVEWTQENRWLLLAKYRLHRATERWIEDGRRDDHLLNPGQPLAEARAVVSNFPEELTDDIYAFVSSAEDIEKRRRLIRFSAAIALAGLSILSTTFAIVALQSKNTAERRERESRRLTDFMLGPLADELRLRDMLGLLKQIGNEGIDYLEDRHPESMSQEELVKTAKSYRTVGEALIDTRNRSQSRKSFEEGYRLADIAVKKMPSDQHAIFERGNDSYWIGKIEFDQKRYIETEYHWNNYLADSEKLSSLDATNADWIMERSYAENVLGTLSLRRGDLAQAMHRFQRSISLKGEAKEANKENLAYQFDYIDSLSWLASTLEAQGNLSEASSQYDTQITMLESLIAKNKSASRWRSRLGNYLMLSAMIEKKQGNDEKAFENAKKAVLILEPLSIDSPDNESLSSYLAKSRKILAETAPTTQKIPEISKCQ